jgi:hypothetical protein
MLAGKPAAINTPIAASADGDKPKCIVYAPDQSALATNHIKQVASSKGR